MCKELFAVDYYSPDYREVLMSASGFDSVYDAMMDAYDMLTCFTNTPDNLFYVYEAKVYVYRIGNPKMCRLVTVMHDFKHNATTL